MLATEPIANPAVLAIDVGYGYTKAISTSGKKTIFPSVIAPARELALDTFKSDDHKKTVGHLVKILRTEDSLEECYFVGDLALREGENVQHTLDRNKHEHPMHDVVLLTAAALCWNWPRRTIAGVEVCQAGLPSGLGRTIPASRFLYPGVPGQKGRVPGGHYHQRHAGEC